MAGLWNLSAPHAPLFYTRLTEQQNLSVPHTPLAVSQWVHALSFSARRTKPIWARPHCLVMGYGAEPHDYPLPLPFAPSRFFRKFCSYYIGGMEAVPPWLRMPLTLFFRPHVHPSPLTFPAYRSFKSSSTPPNSDPSSWRMAPLCRMAWSICSAGN